MSEWREVMDACQKATDARDNAQQYGSAIEDGRTGDPALAILLAAEAICAELRAFQALVHHIRGDAT